MQKSLTLGSCLFRRDANVQVPKQKSMAAQKQCKLPCFVTCSQWKQCTEMLSHSVQLTLLGQARKLDLADCCSHGYQASTFNFLPADSTPASPMIFVLSPGVDPTDSLRKLAQVCTRSRCSGSQV